jgi:DNA-binding CsgD family transcriptional regulator
MAVPPELPLAHLAYRPLERRVLRLAAEGIDTAEIARRFRRREETIQRIFDMIPLHALASGPLPAGDILRPIERRVLRWRAEGADFDAIAAKFKRSAKFVEQIEALARHKLQGDVL